MLSTRRRMFVHKAQPRNWGFCAGAETTTCQHSVPAVSTGPIIAQCHKRAKTTLHHADWLQAGYQSMLVANPYVPCTTVLSLTVKSHAKGYRSIICTYLNTCMAPAFAWAQDTRHAQQGGGCDEDAPCALGCTPHRNEHWLAWRRSLEGGCRTPGAPALLH